MKRAFKLMMVRLFQHSMSQPITKEERYAIIIAQKMLKDKTNDPKLHPSKPVFYIESPVKEMLYKFNTATEEADIVNHTYGYNIKMSSRAARNIYNMFVKETERRREEMEDRYAKNIQHSLSSIASRLK